MLARHSISKIACMSRCCNGACSGAQRGGSVQPVLPDWPFGTVAILATSGREPHAIPISTAMRAGPRRILLALASERESLRRLRADPAVALSVITEGNLALTVYGTARVLDEQLTAEVVAVEIEAERIQDHRRAAFTIDAGVRWRWADAKAQERDARVRAELEQIASRRGPIA
jgi:hypothetical protein